jgi:hypothetical protein
VEQDLSIWESAAGSQGLAPKPVEHLLHGLARLLGSEQRRARVVSNLLVEGERLGGKKVLHPLFERAVTAGHRSLNHFAYLWGYAIRPDVSDSRVQVGMLGGLEGVPELTLSDCRGDHVRGQAGLDVVEHLWHAQKVALVGSLMVWLGLSWGRLWDRMWRVLL